MKLKLKQKFSFSTIIHDEEFSTKESIQERRQILITGGIFLTLISLILTALNIVKHYHFMEFTTAVLALGFAAGTVFAWKGHVHISAWLMAAMCAFNFSIYAVTGENEGFAILWILLVPILSMMLLGLRTGFFLSLYFQVFLIVLFYTPFSAYVQDYYTQTFRIRFPVLYLASFGAVSILMVQRQGLFNEIRMQAYRDGLTGLYNRHYANQTTIRADIAGKFKKLTVVCADINRLKWANDNLGHEAGDELIAGAAHLLEEAFPDDLCFRTGGDEFMVICDRDDVSRSVDLFREKMAAWKGTLAPELSVSLGIASRLEFKTAVPFADLFRKADQAMYQDKTEIYQRNGWKSRS